MLYWRCARRGWKARGEIMRCWQCGSTIRDGAQLCVYCGAKQSETPAGYDTPQGQRSSQRDADERSRPDPRRHSSDSPHDSQGWYAERERPDDRHGPRTNAPRDAYSSERERGEARGRGDDPGYSDELQSARYREDDREWQSRDDSRAFDAYGRYDDSRESAAYSASYDSREESAYGQYDRRERYDEGGYDRRERYDEGGYDRRGRDRYDDPGDSRELDATDERYAQSRDGRGGWDERGRQQPVQRDERRTAGQPPAPERPAPQRNAPQRASRPLRDESFDPRYRGQAPGGLPPLTMERAAFGVASRGRTPHDRDVQAQEYEIGGGQHLVRAPQRRTEGAPGRRALQPADYSQGQTRIPADAPRSRGLRRRISLFVGVMVLVLLVLAIALVMFAPGLRGTLSNRIPILKSQTTGAPAFATYTPGPTPTVLPNYKQYADATTGYILNFPQDWTNRADMRTSGGQPDASELFQSADGFSTFGVEQAAAFATASDDTIVRAEITPLSADGNTVTELTPVPAPRTIGGEIWQHHEYKVTVKGVDEHVTVFACHHAGKPFAIVMISTTQQYANTDTAAFEPMLSTFRFSN